MHGQLRAAPSQPNSSPSTTSTASTAAITRTQDATRILSAAVPLHAFLHVEGVYRYGDSSGDTSGAVYSKKPQTYHLFPLTEFGMEHASGTDLIHWKDHVTIQRHRGLPGVLGGDLPGEGRRAPRVVADGDALQRAGLEQPKVRDGIPRGPTGGACSHHLVVWAHGTILLSYFG